MSTQHQPLLFAAVGDVHGSQHAMLRLLIDWEKRHDRELSFVLQVGDFEPVRDAVDLASLPAPERYRKLGDFANFQEGRVELPWPVWFIAGNHEPFAFLATMPKGGRAAPNCYYLGRAGHTHLEGMRLAWLGGISTEDGPADRIPTHDWKMHAYFTTREVDKTMAGGRADVLLLHDWPQGAATPDEARGMRRSGGLRGPGNETARLLVDLLEPRLVLAGHLHWPHRSRLSERSQFVGLGHIDRGRDAFAVFERDADGAISEISE